MKLITPVLLALGSVVLDPNNWDILPTSITELMFVASIVCFVIWIATTKELRSSGGEY